jgi:hypothetical protein
VPNVKKLNTENQKPMTPEQITRQKAEEIMNNKGWPIPAVTEALNTINWIPIDADNLPEGDVLCLDSSKKITHGMPLRISKTRVVCRFTVPDNGSFVTHYAHVNLP